MQDLGVASPSPLTLPLGASLKILLHTPARRFTHRKTLKVKLAATNMRIPKSAMNFRLNWGTWTFEIWILQDGNGGDRVAPIKP